jgi:division protein CdvB (Snf7/Vps24/ESCRT-III family)
MVKNPFRRDPPLSDLIYTTMRRLQAQQGNLELAAARLQNRNEALFNTCASAIKNGQKERAMIYANEIVEIRRMICTITRSQLAIEQVIIRLETLKEFGDLIKDLNPVLETIRGVAKRLTGMMPEVTLELDNMNNTITETLTTTTMDSKPVITPAEVKVEGSEEILKEVSSLAEEMLKKRLPEPPKPVIKEGGKSAEKVRQLVALAASSSGASEKTEHLTKSYLYEDVKSRRVSLIVQQSPIVENQAIGGAEETGGKGLEVLDAQRQKTKPKEMVKVEQ